MKTSHNIILIIILILITIATQMLPNTPWWSFTIPCLILGFLVKLKKLAIPTFVLGFIAGFIVWFGSNLYFHFVLGGYVFVKIPVFLSVPKILLFIIAGVIGGALSGLSFYTGNLILSNQNTVDVGKEAW